MSGWSALIGRVAAVGAAAWLTWQRPLLFVIAVVLSGLGLASTSLARRFGARAVVAFAVRVAASCLAAASFLYFGHVVDVSAALSIGFLTGTVLASVAMLPGPIVPRLMPLVAASYLRLVLGWPPDVVRRNLIACVVVALIVLACRLRRYLTVEGAFAAWLVGYSTWGVGGARWFVPLLAIFLTVNWAGKFVAKLLKREAPRERDRVEEKGSERDHLQVFANAGVGLVLVLVSAVSRASDWWPSVVFGAYLGSLSAACADSLASEIGILSKTRPVLLSTFRPVPPGQSGGVSTLGYAAAAIGSLIPAVALAFLDGPASWSPRLFLGALACGLMGSTVDSIVGASLQGKRRCATCALVLERPEHCGVTTRWASGFPFVTNDVVNVLGALAGAITGALVS